MCTFSAFSTFLVSNIIILIRRLNALQNIILKKILSFYKKTLKLLKIVIFRFCEKAYLAVSTPIYLILFDTLTLIRRTIKIQI